MRVPRSSARSEHSDEIAAAGRRSIDMARLACLLVVVMTSVAHAESPPPCSIPPANPEPRALELALVDGMLAMAAGSELPAVSTDGELVADLFVDSEDFTGAPITTLVIWSKAGKRVARFQLGPEPAAAMHAASVLHAANARLAQSKWRPLAFHPECGGDAFSATSTVKLDGATVGFD